MIRTPWALLLPATLLLASCAQAFAVRPSPAGEVEIVLTDFDFSPNVIRVQAGQRVRFILRNQARHAHEFMVGRHPIVHQRYLQGPVVEPFAVDFFEGVEVKVSGEGMAMGFAGMEMDEGMDMEEGEGMGMGEGEDMEMGQEEMGEMEMGDMEMEEEHQGGMVMLQPGEVPEEVGQVGVLEMVIPEDKVGTWEIGCFEEDGQHYEDGMRALLIVEG